MASLPVNVCMACLMLSGPPLYKHWPFDDYMVSPKMSTAKSMKCHWLYWQKYTVRMNEHFKQEFDSYEFHVVLCKQIEYKHIVTLDRRYNISLPLG